MSIRAKAAVPPRRAPLTLSLASLAALVVAGCTADAPTIADPSMSAGAATAVADAGAGQAIVVASSADLVAALTPENAGRRIHLHAGSYVLDRLLVVPDGATVEGDGVMLDDAAGRPAGFRPGSRTTLVMTAPVPGDLLTLGNGASVRGIAIEDLAGRLGNAIGVVSRGPGDRLSATIADVEIVNPNAHGVVPAGPTGCGVAVLTLNPNLGGDPAAHVGASVTVRMTRSLIHSPAMGTGCGVFAFNFAASGDVSVTLADNVVGGGVIASGGVSRPDAVHDARTVILSHRNLYRDDTADPCLARRTGWNMQGGAGAPVPLPIGTTERNTLRMLSRDDRLENFTIGVLAFGGRRFFPAPTAGPVNDNVMQLDMLGTVVATASCGGTPLSTDFRLAGAFVTNPAVIPGDGNVLQVVMRGVTGSGMRNNAWGDVLGPTGPQPAALSGAGNRLEIVGSPEAFARTNSAIAPAPAAELFTGGGN